MIKSKDFGVEINADWGRNVYITINNKAEKTIEEARSYAQEIKDEFGERGVLSRGFSGDLPLSVGS